MYANTPNPVLKHKLQIESKDSWGPDINGGKSNQFNSYSNDKHNIVYVPNPNTTSSEEKNILIFSTTFIIKCIVVNDKYFGHGPKYCEYLFDALHCQPIKRGEKKRKKKAGISSSFAENHRIRSIIWKGNN